jgi:hypothetical protein
MMQIPILILSYAFILYTTEAYLVERHGTQVKRPAPLLLPSKALSSSKASKKYLPPQRQLGYEPIVYERWVPPQRDISNPQDLAGVALLTSTNDGHINYMANVTVGDQSFELILDTGSSTTWIIQENFTCIDTVPQTNEWACKFGPTFRGTFAANRSIEGQSSTLLYGNGDAVWGNPGFVDLSIGTLSVPNQQVSYCSRYLTLACC